MVAEVVSGGGSSAKPEAARPLTATSARVRHSPSPTTSISSMGNLTTPVNEDLNESSIRPKIPIEAL